MISNKKINKNNNLMLKCIKKLKGIYTNIQIQYGDSFRYPRIKVIIHQKDNKKNIFIVFCDEIFITEIDEKIRAGKILYKTDSIKSEKFYLILDQTIKDRLLTKDSIIEYSKLIEKPKDSNLIKIKKKLHNILFKSKIEWSEDPFIDNEIIIHHKNEKKNLCIKIDLDDGVIYTLYKKSNNRELINSKKIIKIIEIIMEYL